MGKASLLPALTDVRLCSITTGNDTGVRPQDTSPYPLRLYSLRTINRPVKRTRPRQSCLLLQCLGKESLTVVKDREDPGGSICDGFKSKWCSAQHKRESRGQDHSAARRPADHPCRCAILLLGPGGADPCPLLPFPSRGRRIGAAGGSERISLGRAGSSAGSHSCGVRRS